ncbi:6-bladed beta-propeller [uncultured Bacteroides sp.]|uniref:6-bladed beta-propeller n=1 Tax=uncultured Bacteroides sp. TaxID=162156 RepID=UPI0025EF7C25|nr:6-bladed beta-propeller [uncultured Bacteroides sp.]
MGKNTIFVLIVAAICACCQADSVATSEAVIIDSSQVVHKKTTLMSSVMEVSNVIPLETSDSCLLGEIEKIIKRNGIIYVKSRNNPLMLFDEKGRFLHTAGKIGTGSEEYSMLVDFDIK